MTYDSESGDNPETANLETFVEHCERAETTDDIAGEKFAASDEESEPRKKKRTKTKNDHGKKRIKRSTKMYCSLHGDNTSWWNAWGVSYHDHS